MKNAHAACSCSECWALASLVLTSLLGACSPAPANEPVMNGDEPTDTAVSPPTCSTDPSVGPVSQANPAATFTTVATGTATSIVTSTTTVSSTGIVTGLVGGTVTASATVTYVQTRGHGYG